MSAPRPHLRPALSSLSTNLSFFFQILLLKAFVGLSDLQAHQIDSVACNGFTAPQVQFIPANSFLFSSSCISRWKNEVTGAISAAQLKFLPSPSFEGFSLNWQSVNASALTNLSPSQISSLGAVACEQFTQLQMAALNSLAFSGFTQLCINHIQPNSFSQLSLDQVSQLSLAYAFHTWYPIFCVCMFSLLTLHIHHTAPLDLSLRPFLDRFHRGPLQDSLELKLLCCLLRQPQHFYRLSSQSCQ